MTPREIDRLKSAMEIILLAAAVATLAGAGVVKSLDLETTLAHRADIDRVERKLDCALFSLPKNCHDTLSPRSP